MDQINYQADQEKNKGIDIRNEIYKYIPFWFWFVGFTIISIFVTYLYLRYTPNTYETVAKVKLIDNNNSQVRSVPMTNIKSKFESFGFDTIECDGHNIEQLSKVFHTKTNKDN